MKKAIKRALPLLLVPLLLTACGQKEGGSLTVYLVDTDALYVSALKGYADLHPEVELQLKAFTTYEEMNDQLNTQLMSGKGPDILLLSSLYSGSDVLKLTASGAFLPLDDQMAELPPEEYFEPLLAAGQVDGHQYLLPFSWNILQGYTHETLMAERGYGSDQGLYELLSAEYEALDGVPDQAFCSLDFGRGDPLNFLLEARGVPLTGGGSLTVDETAFRETAELVRLFYNSMDKIQRVSQRYRNDFAGAASHLSIFLENYPFMNNLRYYQSVYPYFLSEEMVFSTMERRDGGLTAQVIQYGAINANTRSPKEAWKLLRHILDTPVSMDFSKYDGASVFYAPVSASLYEDCVRQLENSPGPGPKKKVDPLSVQNAVLLRQIPQELTAAIIPNPSLRTVTQEAMAPYFTGEKDFDSCNQDFLSQLTLYLGE